MSHRVLQRTLVRLLHDPTLVERMKVSGVTALEEPNLTDDERSWLEAADPRAFQTDPYRQARVLTSLVEELPTASALAASRLAGGLNGYFASRLFHQTIRDDGALRLTFAEYLVKTGPDVNALVQLEKSVMAARRSEEAPAGEISVPVGVTWLNSPSGALALYQALWEALVQTGVPLAEAVLTVSQAPPPQVQLGVGEEQTLLIEPDGAGGFHVGEIPSGLKAVLSAAREHGTRRACAAAAIAAGAEADEASEIIEELISEGLLTTCSA